MTAHRPSRRLRRLWAGLTAAVCGILLAPTTTEAPAAAVVSVPTVVSAADVPLPPDTTMTGTDGNAVTAADRDFVVRVRLAGL